MSDIGTPTNDVTLEQLAARIAQVNEQAERARAEAAALKEQNVELHSRLSRLEGAAPSNTPESSLSPPDKAAAGNEGGDPQIDRVVSRRGAMKALGAAAAGGVGLAVGSVMMTEMPAAAADGDNLVLGQAASNASTTQTSLTDSDTSGSHSAIYTILGAASGAPLSSAALFGDSNTSSGVIGATSAAGANGVQGIDVSTAGAAGVYGQSTKGYGVVGKGEIGVFGECTATTGLILAGIVGTGKGSAPGVIAVGDTAGPAMQILPLSANTLPASPSTGQVVVLQNGSLWYCAAAGHWTQLNQSPVNLLHNPIRVFDSRTSGALNPALPGRAAGPLTVGSPITLQITGATVGGLSVPAGAVGVIGNVTAVDVSGIGWLTLYPAGVTTPTDLNPSTINYQAGQYAVANSCIVGLSTSGQMDILCFQSATDVIFDITGYLL
jgi:hypothetical protein